MKWAAIVGIALAMAAASSAWAGPAFCTGFAAGWRAGYENRHMIVGILPICPIPAVGGDTYEAGFERGLEAALGQIRQ